MIYFLFDPEDNASYIKEVGVWGNILVGGIDEGLLLYIDLPKSIIVSEEVAYAWKYAGKYKGSISVRENTNSYDQIDTSLLEPNKDKFKYTLSEIDKENACLFHKAVMYFLLNKYYQNKLLLSNSTPEEMRNDKWKSEAQLMEDKKKIIMEIESCQDWHETGILISNRFGIAHIPEAQAKIDL
jgi:hypothetical protein